MEKEEYNEPFVFEVVAVPEFAGEMERDGGGGKGEVEGFVLPYIIGSERGESLEDLEVKGLELRSYGGWRRSGV